MKPLTLPPHTPTDLRMAMYGQGHWGHHVLLAWRYSEVGETWHGVDGSEGGLRAVAPRDCVRTRQDGIRWWLEWRCPTG